MTASGSLPVPAQNVTVNGLPAQSYGDFTYAAANQTLVSNVATFLVSFQNLHGAGSSTTFSTLPLPATVTLRYDNNGNLTNDGTRSFSYSPENQLTNITVAGQWKNDFVYDGLGRRRIERDFSWQSPNWQPTTELRFIYDGWVLLQVRDTNNNALATYTRGIDFSGSLHGAGGIGGLLAWTDGGGSSYFYHADGAGNITAMMDGNLNMAARYLYTPFGGTLGKWGPQADANVMRFSSKPWHSASGTYDFGFRQFMPNLMRFSTQDPIGEAGGINLYGFVGNDPLRYADPWGFQGTQLELDLERPEPEPVRYPRGEMPDDELIRARDRLLSGPPPNNMEIGGEPPPVRPPTAGEILAYLRDHPISEQLGLFPPEQLELPFTYPRTGRPTSGVLCYKGNYIPFRSGNQGPAARLPRGPGMRGSGFDAYTRTHVEGNAAAFMRQQGIPSATLNINNPEICSQCELNLPRMLPPGASLRVVLPDGTVAQFVGSR
jgi:RHS repeat-associated protein